MAWWRFGFTFPLAFEKSVFINLRLPEYYFFFTRFLMASRLAGLAVVVLV